MRPDPGDWVHGLAPWQVIAHMTFAWEASVWSAQRCYEKFMKRELWGVSYFYALEQNPSRDGYHVHALWCDCQSKYSLPPCPLMTMCHGKGVNALEAVEKRVKCLSGMG